MKRKIFLIFLLVFTAVIHEYTENIQKVKVIVKLANIRAKPGLDGDIIGKANFGDIFIVIKREGNWYKIDFPSERKGGGKFGYIHKSITKILSSETDTSLVIVQEDVGKKETKENRDVYSKSKQDSVNVRKKLFDQKKLFSGFYARLGLMTSPKVDNFGDKWIADFGFDSPIGKYLSWGLEVQPYLRSYSVDTIDFSYTLISTNMFLNVKGGLALGGLIKFLKPVTIFIGGGPGVALSYSSIKQGTASGTIFDTFFAWHILYGIELKLGKIAIVLEFQNNKIIKPDFEPTTESSSFFLFGIRL